MIWFDLGYKIRLLNAIRIIYFGPNALPNFKNKGGDARREEYKSPKRVELWMLCSRSPSSLVAGLFNKLDRRRGRNNSRGRGRGRGRGFMGKGGRFQHHVICWREWGVGGFHCSMTVHHILFQSSNS